MILNKAKAKIPGCDNKNVRLYYLFSYIHESFFTEGNWIYLFLMFFNYTELGILDAITMGIGVFLEVPTGALADLIGKRKTIILSFFTNLLGLILMCLAQNPTMLFLGNLILCIGLATYSGASDAFVYESLENIKSATNFEKVFAFSKSLKSIAFVIAAGIGAVAATINVRLPFILWGLCFLIGTVASFQMKEPGDHHHESISWQKYWQQSVAGIKQLFKPALKPYVSFILILLGIDYIYGWGFLKPAILLNLKFNALTMGSIFVTYGIISAVIINYLPLVRKHVSDYTGILVLNLCMILCMYLFATGNQLLGFIVAICASVIGMFGYTWINIIINENTESGLRATTISSVAMLLKIPLLIISPFAGAIIDAGYLQYFLIGFASLMLLGTLVTVCRNLNMLKSH